MSQLVRISRICDNYVSFLKRHQLLTKRLIKQGFWYSKLNVSFKKFSRRHSMLFNKYAVKRHIREGIDKCTTNDNLLSEPIIFLHKHVMF